ncbi:MAG: DMT family transporter [Cyanobacteria bacterium P01_G01_bin.38]
MVSKSVLSKNLKVFLMLLIGLIAYSSGAIFIRLAIATEGIQGPGFSLFLSASRLAMASLLFMPAWQGFLQARYAIKHLRWSLISGVGLAGYLATWMMSLNYTSITASTTLSNLHPVLAIFLAWWWFKDAPKRLALVGTAFALAGSFMISLATPAQVATYSVAWLGNSLALAGALSNGLYILLGHQAQSSGIKMRHHMALVHATATVILLPLPLLLKVGYTGYSTLTYGYVLLLALIPQLIGHTCFNWAMGWVKPQLLTLVILGEPIVASLLGYWVFREVQGVGVLVGAMILVAGVAIATLSTQNQEHKSQAELSDDPLDAPVSF